jgi:uncharacterized membrane protein
MGDYALYRLIFYFLNNVHNWTFSIDVLLGIIDLYLGGVFMSMTFWITILVFVLFIIAMLTSSYNEDKTSGL